MNKFFETRNGTDEVGSYLANATGTPLESLVGLPPIKILDISHRWIYCSPQRGSPNHYKMQAITPDQIRAFLPTLIEVAKWLDGATELHAPDKDDD